MEHKGQGAFQETVPHNLVFANDGKDWTEGTMIEYINLKKRKDEHSLSIENYFGDGYPRFTVRASNKDWQKLLDYYDEQCKKTNFETANCALGELFYSAFLLPAKHTAIGRGEYRQMIIRNLKILAGFYHNFFKYCFKKIPKENLPPSVKTVEKSEDFTTQAVRKDLPEYTAYCLQDAFSSVIARFGLTPFWDLRDDINIGNALVFQGSESVYVTYVLEGKQMIEDWSSDQVAEFWSRVHDEIALAMDMTVTWKRLLKRRNREHIIPKGKGGFHVSLAKAFLWVPGEDLSEEIQANRDILVELYPGFYDRKKECSIPQSTFLERFQN
jgi:hypothetical protein